MKYSEIELPSNRKFGFFFSTVFAIFAAYFYNAAPISWAFSFAFASMIFLIITLLKDDLLLPFNKIWMRFGFMLSIIVSPIILGLIFFGIFTPISVFMRLGGRDEMRLKFSKKTSHWILRSDPIKSRSFKNQF